MSAWNDQPYQQYKLLPSYDMDEFFTDEQKFKQLPWEDNMYVFYFGLLYHDNYDNMIKE